MTNEVPTERVLSTLNRDGTRRWIRPKLAQGRFLRRRRVVGYALIALFVLLPRLRIAGRPAVLIDLGAARSTCSARRSGRATASCSRCSASRSCRRCSSLTALWGRVWCGWGCPQTVYLELVFRPIERWLEGSRGQRATPARARRSSGPLFSALGVRAVERVPRLLRRHRPARALGVRLAAASIRAASALVVGVAALMLFDFGWFREQMCIVACPYGRLQSVLLDRQSLIVGYDAQRGEPRGKPKKKLPRGRSRGDCVDCAACVAVCPTGIDIRDGLQMECIGCAQCIDACDAVMDKLGRAQGLIRYTSQDELAGKPARSLRARTIAYPAAARCSRSGLLAWAVRGRTGDEFAIERAVGPSFVELPDGDDLGAGAASARERQRGASPIHARARRHADATLRSQAVYEVKPHKSLEVPLFVDVATRVVRARQAAGVPAHP